MIKLYILYVYHNYISKTSREETLEENIQILLMVKTIQMNFGIFNILYNE